MSKFGQLQHQHDRARKRVSLDHSQIASVINGVQAVVTSNEFWLDLSFFRNMDRAMSWTHLLEAVRGPTPADGETSFK